MAASTLEPADKFYVLVSGKEFFIRRDKEAIRTILRNFPDAVTTETNTFTEANEFINKNIRTVVHDTQYKVSPRTPSTIKTVSPVTQYIMPILQPPRLSSSSITNAIMPPAQIIRPVYPLPYTPSVAAVASQTPAFSIVTPEVSPSVRSPSVRSPSVRSPSRWGADTPASVQLKNLALTTEAMKPLLIQTSTPRQLIKPFHAKTTMLYADASKISFITETKPKEWFTLATAWYTNIKGKRKEGRFVITNDSKVEKRTYPELKDVIENKFDNKYDAESFLNQEAASLVAEDGVLYGPERRNSIKYGPYEYVPLSKKSLIFTDGSHIPDYDSFTKKKNTHCGCGFAVVIIKMNLEKYVAYGKIDPKYCCTTAKALEQGSHLAEVYAIFIAVSLLVGDLIIYSDSTYSIEDVTMPMKEFERINIKHDVDGNPIKKFDDNGWNLIIETREKIAKYVASGTGTIEFRPVRAHAGVPLNVEADKYARIGLEQDYKLVIERVLEDGKHIEHSRDRD